VRAAKRFIPATAIPGLTAGRGGRAFAGVVIQDRTINLSGVGGGKPPSFDKLSPLDGKFTAVMFDA